MGARLELVLNRQDYFVVCNAITTTFVSKNIAPASWTQVTEGENSVTHKKRGIRTSVWKFLQRLLAHFPDDYYLLVLLKMNTSIEMICIGWGFFPFVLSGKRRRGSEFHSGFPIYGTVLSKFKKIPRTQSSCCIFPKCWYHCIQFKFSKKEEEELNTLQTLNLTMCVPWYMLAQKKKLAVGSWPWAKNV